MEDLTKGFAELQNELDRYAKGVSEPYRRQALDAGADIIVERARAIAPVDTGKLKREGIVKGDNDGSSIQVGWTKEEFYGRFLENGTSKMAPRPHIRPAYEQTKTRVADKMLSEMKLK